MPPIDPRRCVFLGLLGIAACGGGATDTDGGVDAGDTAPDTVPAREFDFELGVIDRESGEFGAISPDDTLDIVIGFQGLVFVELAVRGPAELPAYLGADVEVTFPDRPEFDYGFWQNRVEFDPAADGVRVAPLFWVPFGQDVALINGQRIELEVRLIGEDWFGSESTAFVIEDLDGCVMTVTGEFECDPPTD